MKIIYPGVKRNSDGKLTESKLILVDPKELIGRKNRTAESRAQIHERGRHNYIKF